MRPLALRFFSLYLLVRSVIHFVGKWIDFTLNPNNLFRLLS